MSGDTTVIEREKLKLDEIVLPKIKKYQFMVKAEDLYKLPRVEDALEYAEELYGLPFCEQHVYPVVDLVREHFKSKEMTVKKYDTTALLKYFDDVFIAAALHDAKEREKITAGFIKYYSLEKEFYSFYLSPVMREPLKKFKKPIERTQEHMKRLAPKGAAAHEAKIISIADKICELPYYLKFNTLNETEIEKHIEASIPYLMLAEEIQLPEFYEKLKKIMIQGLKLLE